MINVPKVQPGDPLAFSAEVYNQTIDLLNKKPTGGKTAPGRDSDNGTVYLFKISSNATQGGLYLARYFPNYKVAQTLGTDITVATAITPAGVGAECYVFNWIEAGKSTHILNSSIPGLAIRAGSIVDGTKIYPLLQVGAPNQLPPATNKYQVLMIVDDNGTIAWDYPRFTI